MCGTGITTRLQNNGFLIGQFTYTVGTSSTAIPHGMDYAPNSVTVMPQADARVWQSAASTATYIYLQASVSVSCDIEFG
jgi:hypothetical protein